MSINNISYNSCLQKSIEDTNRGTILSLRSLLIAVTGMLISPLVGHFSDIYGFSTTFFVLRNHLFKFIIYNFYFGQKKYDFSLNNGSLIIFFDHCIFYCVRLIHSHSLMMIVLDIKMLVLNMYSQ